MAYYNKQEIFDYISENMADIKSRGIEPLNPELEAIKRVNDEEDLVAFFWIDLDSSAIEGQKIKMEGKMWYRISNNLYTDDRFAIDLYQAMKEGLNVTDIINMREHEKEIARRSTININDVEKRIEENINKDGVE